MAEAPKYGNEQRPLIVINKAAVHAAELLYQYISSTIDALFDDKLINTFNESTKTSDKLRNSQLTIK